MKNRENTKLEPISIFLAKNGTQYSQDMTLEEKISTVKYGPKKVF